MHNGPHQISLILKIQFLPVDYLLES